MSQQARNIKAVKSAPGAKKSLALSFPLLLLVILCALWAKSFLPGYVAFNNDGPLGEQNTAWSHFPSTLTGSWDDLNDIGQSIGASSPTITATETWFLGPVGYSKFYVPIALFILGMGAWTFFRQLKLSPLAATLGALATALNGSYVGNACWGTAPQQIAMAAVFFALALVMANTEETPRLVRWSRLALAGMAVGLSVMEGADNGAIFSLFVAGFVFFKSLVERSAPMLKKVGRGIGHVAVIAFFAAMIAAQTITSLLGAFASNSTGSGQNSDLESPQEHWDWATEWSLPKMETLGVFVPGIFGYRMDTPKDMMGFFHDSYEGGEYWGGMGRTPAYDRFFASHPGASLPDDVARNGMMRFGYGGYYAGILVVLVVLFAIAQSFRKENSIFPEMQRRFIWFWMAALGIALLLAWGRFAPFYQFLYMLPYFKTIRNPAKFLAIFYLAMVIIFAYGIDGLYQSYFQAATGKSTDKPSPIRDRFKNWWTNFAFDRNWILFCIGVFIVTLIACAVYGSSSAGMMHYLQKVGFPNDPTSPADAGKIFDFSVGQSQWFLLFLAGAIVLFILVLAGAFSGKRAWVGGLLLGAFLVIDLGRANLPWIIHWDYKQKYDIAADDPTVSISTNPLINLLRDKPYEHRVTELSSDGTFDSLYRIEWMQHHFPYYNIQCSDIIQSSRVASDLAAYDLAMRPTQDKPYLLPRRWELTNTRYFLAPAAYLDLANNQVDPVQRRFHYAQRYSIAYKPGVVNPTEMEQLTLETNANGDYALIEFAGALPRAKLYTHWETNSLAELKNFSTGNLSPSDQFIFSGSGTNGFLTLQKLASPNFDPDQTVLLDAPVPGMAPASLNGQTSGTVDFKSYEPKHIILSAQASAPSILLLSDRYDPNWHVLVDGKPAPMLRADFIMRGVYLTPGSHTVEFLFSQPHGPLFITVLTMFGGISLCALLFFYTRKPPLAANNIRSSQRDSERRASAGNRSPSSEVRSASH
jgi:hypothetical protein